MIHYAREKAPIARISAPSVCNYHPTLSRKE